MSKEEKLIKVGHVVEFTHNGSKKYGTIKGYTDKLKEGKNAVFINPEDRIGQFIRISDLHDEKGKSLVQFHAEDLRYGIVVPWSGVRQITLADLSGWAYIKPGDKIRVRKDIDLYGEYGPEPYGINLYVNIGKEFTVKEIKKDYHMSSDFEAFPCHGINGAGFFFSIKVEEFPSANLTDRMFEIPPVKTGSGFSDEIMADLIVYQWNKGKSDARYLSGIQLTDNPKVAITNCPGMSASAGIYYNVKEVPESYYSIFKPTCEPVFKTDAKSSSCGDPFRDATIVGTLSHPVRVLPEIYKENDPKDDDILKLKINSKKIKINLEI